MMMSIMWKQQMILSSYLLADISEPISALTEELIIITNNSESLPVQALTIYLYTID